MKKPSPQFIGKLEEELRLAYRAQYQPQKAAHPVMNFFKFFVPAISGALVLVILLMNFKGGFVTNPANDQTSQENGADVLVTFNEGTAEEQVVQNFDNDELSQIDSNVRLIADSNY